MQLQGETVIGATPVMGYLHRSSEKLGEARTYVQGTVLTDRMDYLSPITTNWAYALAIERLTGLVVPERAEFLRVITGELSRIQSHLVAVGTFGMDVGTYGTPLLYALREREAVLDLLSLPTGVRMNPSYIRYGGVARDAPPEFFPQLERFLRIFPVEDRRVRGDPDRQRGVPQSHHRRRHDPARGGHARTASPGRSCAPAASTTTCGGPSRTRSTTASTGTSRFATTATASIAT